MKKKNKKKKRKQNKKIYSKSECVFLGFHLFIYLWNFFYDKIAKNKEEFNILICSRSRIINLYVSCISNIWWKDKIFKTSLTYQSHEAAYLR